MPKLKLRYEQTHVSEDIMEERLELCRWYLALTRTMQELTFPQQSRGFGSNLELMLVLMGVFIGDAEGRHVTATKIAHHCGLSRPAVYRRLAELIKLGKVVRDEHSYFVAPGAAPLDPEGHLPAVLRKFPPLSRPKRTV